MPPLLEIHNLQTILHTGTAPVRAVDGLSLGVNAGETFALLGESGCGKSMTALSIMRLLPQSGEIVAGSVNLAGEELLALPEAKMRDVRGKRVGMIFQEPMLSLNPVLTVAQQILEVLARHFNLRGDAADQKALALLEQVGIPDARRRLHEYPFQLSGGMRQRVMIAIALACEPELLIADEPTTALDVTIQAQVLDLMRALQQKNGMAILLITHDLGVVSEMADQVAVMYAGEIVETATRAQFFKQPAHPYSQKLFASLPNKAKRDQGLAVIGGSVPPLSQTFVGCRFAARCDAVMEVCRSAAPGWSDVAGAGKVRCHLWNGSVGRKSAAPSAGSDGNKQGDALPFPLSLSAPPPSLRSPREGGGDMTTELSGSSTSSSILHPPSLEEHINPHGQAQCLPLQVTDLKIYFPIRKGLFKHTVGQVKAVDGVSLNIPQGKTLALVGESGCGKTTVGKGILQLIPVTAGSVRFNGSELVGLGRQPMREKRADLQIIFQDPYASLNPRMRITDILEEGINALGGRVEGGDSGDVIAALLQQVGLPPEARFRYPHEFSGGQRQRVAIARALAVNPKLLICDEPTSALDVSVQAQILNLLKNLQDTLGLSYLFITHNISVVEYLAHEVAVMYLGRIVERGSVEEVLDNPKHPYTQALLSAVPVIDASKKQAVIRLQGDMPSPANPPSGCHFHPRCPQAMPQCRGEYPAVKKFGETHEARCYLY